MWKEKVKEQLRIWRQNKKLMKNFKKLLACMIVLIAFSVVNALQINGTLGIVLRAALFGIMLGILASLYTKN